MCYNEHMRLSILFFIILLSVQTYATKKLIFVDLDIQKAYAYEDEELVFQGRISSGIQGYSTPTGTFKVLEKKKIPHIKSLAQT